MDMAQQTRRDPTPLGQGWELPVVLLGAAVIAAALAALAGMGAAAAVAGAGWVWPAGTPAMLHTLAGLLTGHPGRGLPPAAAGRLPGPGWVYAGAGTSEALLLVVAVAAGTLTHRHWRTAPRRGMASRAQAADALGVTELRAARRLIRPDLYPTRRPRRGSEN